jgi:penicillin amidase
VRSFAIKSVWLIGGLVFAAACTVLGVLDASLPRRTGAADVESLRSPAVVELDARGIPKVRAANLGDALRAQGFLHAQARFFEMDLARRAAAGELAALVGEPALRRDIAQRRFELRRRARRVLDELAPVQRARLDAYVQGVNAGLADLGARPPEYWLLGSKPQPWRAEDSVLVVLSLYTMLSSNESYEKPQGVMRATLPPALYTFLTPSTSRFDRLLVPVASGAASDYRPLPIPPADVVDLRRAPAPHYEHRRVDPPLIAPASNQWAVDASRGAQADAILANDPHLRLRLPNVFYRSELYWAGGAARGVGIPGVPGILIGASDSLAWGATVSNADQADWVVIDVDPADPSRYRVPGGFEPFTETNETIAVAGRDTPVTLTVRSTRYGPVVDQDWRGRPLALHATWLEPSGANFGLLDLMQAADVAQGRQVLGRWAGPSLNWMLSDADGAIGWVVNGPLPNRVGFDGSVPVSWADGRTGWDGELASPALLGSGDGALFTANNRTLPRARAARYSRMWMRPTRARRIDELLHARQQFTERDFLAMQLDTRAEGYDQIRDVLLDVVPPQDPEPLLREARAEVERWNGRADVLQSGFRVLHLYYQALLERVLGPMLAPAAEADPQFVYRWPLADESLRRVLDERPPQLLCGDCGNWSAFLRAVLLDALRRVQRDDAEPPIDAPWGEANRLDVAHPFAGVLPVIGARLRLPPRAQPGSMVSLRVAAPSYGAVIRMAVSPAHPERGILEMEGGQSGHFLSRHFRDLQPDWAAGRPTPFLAGPAVSSFALEPR